MTSRRSCVAPGVLGRLAAAKHALGARLAFAALGAPAVEAAVATVAIAQEELGHARLLYASDARLRGEDGDEDADVPTAPPDPDLVPPLPAWADVLATLATLDTGVLLWLRALATGGQPWLRARAQRMSDEEAFHRDYVRGWVQVAREHPRLGRALDSALAACRPRYRAWLAALAADAAPLTAAGVLAAAPTAAAFDEAVAALVTTS